MLKYIHIGFLLLIMTTSQAARADVRLASIFGDGMVIQHGVDVHIWGWAEPGEAVAVSVGKQLLDVNVQQQPDGAWLATIPSQKPGPVDDITIKGKNTLTIKDVLAGEVWLCSGQSNMQFGLKSEMHANTELPKANHPQIRLFTAASTVAREPATDVKGKWEVCTPDSAANVSAVAYYFGRKLQTSLNVPIGLVCASQGWTPGEAWMSREALSTVPELKKDVLDPWDHADQIYPKAAEEYQAKKKAWDDAQASAPNVDHGPAPEGPFDPGFMHRPCGFWNGAIAPLTRLSIAGVIWYQGETNVARADQYARLFPTLIEGWRGAFNRADLPFLFVEIAPVSPPATQPGGSQWHEVGTSPWAELREAQRAALKLPRVAMVPTIDIGYTLDVHPLNKRDVGDRLASAALTVVYDKPTRFIGPVYKSHKIDGDTVRITFDSVDGGLHFRGGGPEGFAICGEDKKWYFTPATIEGDEVVIKSPKTPAPAAVRYAWSDYAVANLYDGSGFPVEPFRTDDWPPYTRGKTILTPEEMGFDMQTLLKKKPQ